MKVVGETVEPAEGKGKKGEEISADDTTPAKCFTVVDCGCGKAYLTISLWYYLTNVLKYPNVRVIGIDRRSDVIAAAQKMAAQLDLADKVVFVEADLTETTLEALAEHPASPIPQASRVDMVVSLHACDTATDEALAKGVEWKARYILSAPCCQHELQKVLGKEEGRGKKEEGRRKRDGWQFLLLLPLPDCCGSRSCASGCVTF